MFFLIFPDKTIKLWKVSERDKRAEGYNLKEDNGLLRDPGSINTLRVRGTRQDDEIMIPRISLSYSRTKKERKKQEKAMSGKWGQSPLKRNVEKKERKGSAERSELSRERDREKGKVFFLSFFLTCDQSEIVSNNVPGAFGFPACPPGNILSPERRPTLHSTSHIYTFWARPPRCLSVCPPVPSAFFQLDKSWQVGNLLFLRTSHVWLKSNMRRKIFVSEIKELKCSLNIFASPKRSWLLCLDSIGLKNISGFVERPGVLQKRAGFAWVLFLVQLSAMSLRLKLLTFFGISVVPER